MFPLSWRITDERWSKQSEEVLSRLVFLNSERARLLTAQTRVFRYEYPWRLRYESWHAEESTSLDYRNDSDVNLVRRWLDNLPVTRDTEVYVVWARQTALVTRWETMAAIWDDLFYPFDEMNVFDDTLGWALLLGQEECAVFARPGAAVDAIHGDVDPCGRCLIDPSVHVNLG